MDGQSRDDDEVKTSVKASSPTVCGVTAVLWRLPLELRLVS